MDEPATKGDVAMWGLLACGWGAENGLAGTVLACMALVTLLMSCFKPSAPEGE